MGPRVRASLIVAAVLASIVSARAARADCMPAHEGPLDARLPKAWRDAVDRLVRSTKEPGHPWSCSGGRIEAELTHGGVRLHIAREGEEVVTRLVAEPADLMPLGQALLAAPLALTPTSSPMPSPSPSPPSEPERAEGVASSSPEPTVLRGPTPDAIPDRAPAPPSPRDAPRVLVGGGVDGRAAGSSSGAWIGPSVSAAVPMGRWLPGISLRQQSGVGTGGPPASEVSVALAVQGRFQLRPIELRAGLALRGAVVVRDLPRPQGSQSQLQGRAGPIVSVVIPVLRWASLVLSADADVLCVSRTLAEPASTSGATPFPTFTIGGAAGLEVPF